MTTNKISQRDAFWNRIFELAKKDSDVIIISADMGAPALDQIRRHLAAQFINVGIAEQNAITLATGLALTGKKVYTFAIAPFITLRCLEQIRVCNAIMKIPINIVGVGVGFGYEDSGPTHHLIEDLAIMRAFPNIKIHTITDTIMASTFAEISYQSCVTNYIRLDRQVTENIYDSNHDFSPGLTILREGKHGCIVSTGFMTHRAMEISQALEQKGIYLGVIDLHTIPINEPLLLKEITKTDKLITIEEHLLPGGLGSAVCEVLCDHRISMPIKRFGLPMVKEYCYKYGGREKIHEYYGIDRQALLEQITDFITDRS